MIIKNNLEMYVFYKGDKYYRYKDVEDLRYRLEPRVTKKKIKEVLIDSLVKIDGCGNTKYVKESSLELINIQFEDSFNTIEDIVEKKEESKDLMLDDYILDSNEEVEKEESDEIIYPLKSTKLAKMLEIEHDKLVETILKIKKARGKDRYKYVSVPHRRSQKIKQIEDGYLLDRVACTAVSYFAECEKSREFRETYNKKYKILSRALDNERYYKREVFHDICVLFNDFCVNINDDEI